MIGHSKALYLSLGLACISAFTPAFAQTPANQVPANQSADRSAAYYDFAMAHLYAELAGA